MCVQRNVIASASQLGKSDECGSLRVSFANFSRLMLRNSRATVKTKPELVKVSESPLLEKPDTAKLKQANVFRIIGHNLIFLLKFLYALPLMHADHQLLIPGHALIILRI